MSIYADAISLIDNPEVLVSAAEYRRIILAVLAIPKDFTYFSDAENYVINNPYGYARVIKYNEVVTTIYGNKYKWEGLQK